MKLSEVLEKWEEMEPWIIEQVKKLEEELYKAQMENLSTTLRSAYGDKVRLPEREDQIICIKILRSS